MLYFDEGDEVLTGIRESHDISQSVKNAPIAINSLLTGFKARVCNRVLQSWDGSFAGCWEYTRFTKIESNDLSSL